MQKKKIQDYVSLFNCARNKVYIPPLSIPLH